MITPSLAQSNGYEGGALETYQHSNIKGDLLFISGNSKYSGELSSGANYSVVFDTALPEGSKMKIARIYLYWTWSHNGIEGVYPEMSAFFKGSPVSAEKQYTDRKGSGTYDYPSGTYAYDVTAFPLDRENSFIVKNAGMSKFAINGAGLLLVYENANKQDIEYWINEGIDIIYAAEGVTSEQATTRAYFNGDNDIKRITNANLITVVPGGNKGKNTLYFNSKSWEGIFKGIPYDDLAIDVRDVSGYLLPGNNEIRIQDTGDYLVPSNAFLILKFAESSSDQGSGMRKTSGFEFVLSLVSILAIVSILKCVNKQEKK
jgi:hypothetical protein